MASETDRGITCSIQDSKVEYTELKFIGSEELDRTWRSTVRERHKLQDMKMWEDFCKNEDVASGVFADDPYKFLGDVETIAEEDFKFDEKTKETDRPPVIIEENEVESHYASGDTGSPRPDIQTYRDDEFIPFVEDPVDKAANELNVQLNNSQDIAQILSTVRESTEEEKINEIHIDHVDATLTTENKEIEEIANDNIENGEELTPKISSSIKTDKQLYNAFQSSVYYEKIKDLRNKINKILHSIMELFMNVTNYDYDPIDLRKSLKRANEFSGRFTRIYIYQLQRQLSDIKRHMSVLLPYGKRTQFQAQATRVLSLHQNIVQALQMLQHPFEKSLFLGQGGQPLQALLDFIVDATNVCCKVAPSNDLNEEIDQLYNDEIIDSCEQLDLLTKEHMQSMDTLIDMEETTPRTSRMKLSSRRDLQSKLSHLPYRQKLAKRDKTSPKYGCSSRGSAYSVDKMSLNLRTGSKNSSSAHLDKRTERAGSLSKTSLLKPTISSEAKRTSRNIKEEKSEKYEDSETNKSEASTRRPLMRGRKDKKKMPIQKIHEEEIETMMEMECPQERDPPANTSHKKAIPSSPKTPKTPKFQNVVPAPAEGTAAAGSTRARAAVGGDVTALLLHELCGERETDVPPAPADPNRVKCVSGASNAQLLCVTRESPRRSPRQHRPVAPAATTPQLLKILEEKIQKQPLQVTEKKSKLTKGVTPNEKTNGIPDKVLMHFNLSDRVLEDTDKYRRQFIEYMMSSPMYLNSAYNKPWEVIERATDKILEELLLNAALDMQLEKVLLDLFHVELNN